MTRIFDDLETVDGTHEIWAKTEAFMSVTFKNVTSDFMDWVIGTEEQKNEFKERLVPALGMESNIDSSNLDVQKSTSGFRKKTKGYILKK
jgi:hypothetical protein